MQGSLWLALGGRLGHLSHGGHGGGGFGDYSLSPVDELLNREAAVTDPAATLDQLLELDDLMQEAKFGNNQLIEL
jgi:hypothetical protein